MDEVLRSGDSSEGQHLMCAKGLREFESLIVNRTHGLTDDEALMPTNPGISYLLGDPGTEPMIRSL